MKIVYLEPIKIQIRVYTRSSAPKKHLRHFSPKLEKPRFDSVQDFNFKFGIQTSAAKPDPFFLGSTQFWAQFLGSNGSGWPSGSKNGSNWFGLTSKRVQIWVQPYNIYILNKPDLNPTHFQVGPSGSKIRLSWVGLALRVKIRIGLVRFIWLHL